MRVCKHGCDFLDSRVFFLEIFYKDNRGLFRVYIASSKHSGGWENSGQLCKPETAPRVCIIVSNSPNLPRV